MGAYNAATGTITQTSTLVISATGSLDATGHNITGGTSFSMASSGTFNVASHTCSSTYSLTAGTSSISGNISATTLTMSGSTTRTVNMGGGTYTLSGTGNVVNLGAGPTNFTLNAQTSTIDLTDTSASTKAFVGGGKTFNNLRVRGAASAGTVTISGANTFNTLTFDADANIVLTSTVTQAASSFAPGGTSGHPVLLSASTPGSAAILAVNSTAPTIDYLTITDITKTAGDAFYAGANSINGGGNTGFIFSAKPPSGQSFVGMC